MGVSVEMNECGTGRKTPLSLENSPENRGWSKNQKQWHHGNLGWE